MSIHRQSPQSDNEKTPEQYAFAIAAHAKKEMRESLYPGTNYRHLAMFLAPHKPRASTSRLQIQTKHDYVVIHDLKYSHGDDSRVSSFDSEDGISDFSAYPLPATGSGHLVFIRGYPTPQWVAAIGARYGVDPEYFRRFLRIGQSREYFDLPALPSSSANIINVPITTIGRHSGFPTTIEPLSRHFSLLESCAGVGHSIVRQFSVHDDAYFSIEQSVLVCVVKTKGNGWNALICSDIGRDLSEGPSGPWTGINPKIHNDIFLPTIRSEPRISLKKSSKWSTIQASPLPPGQRSSPFVQSASLLPHHSYGRFLSDSLMRVDAFYSLHELFSFSACAENQFLNLLKWKLEAIQEYKYAAERESMQSILQALISHKKILDDHLEGLQRTISAIEARASFNDSTQEHHRSPSRNLSVPLERKSRSETSPYLLDETEIAASRLLTDFNHLLRISQTLSVQYTDSMANIRNKTQLHESQQGITQAKGVARLTLLAFFFVPLSFTTSFFGMNFAEIGQDRALSLWIWFTVSVPIMLISLLICFWGQVLNTLRNSRTYK